MEHSDLFRKKLDQKGIGVSTVVDTRFSVFAIERAMQETGFEPAKALSHQILSLAPLTAWVLLR